MPEIRRKRRTQYATSLIEVLVVMVILLIGIFAVIRVFPIGFQYMKNAENRSAATRLASAQLEAVRTDEANLPESVTFSFYTAAGVRQTVSGLSPDYDLLTEIERTSALDAANSFYRDLNLYRYVQGERVKVPLPTIAPGVSGSLYTVKLGPIYMDPAYSDPALTLTPIQEAAFDQYLKVTGAPMTGASADSDNGTTPVWRNLGDLRTVNNYVIDYGTDGGDAYLLVRAADHERTFLVSFSKEVGGNATQTLEDIPVIVPANTFAWMPIPGGADLLPGSEVVKQRFKRISSATAWDADNPYQYRLARPNIADGASFTFANIGMLVFNPNGATYSEAGQSFSAYVDYAVLDWHIIRDDREVPSSVAGTAGDVPVRLSVQKLKLSGDENIDGTDYVGVFPSNDPTANSDIVVIRMDTGLPLSRGDYALRATTDSGAGFWVNGEGRDNTYGSGVIYVNTNVVPRGTPLRVLYKGSSDWGVSLSKAAANYRPTMSGGAYLPHPPLTPTDHDGDVTTDPLPLGDSAAFGVYALAGREYMTFNYSELNKSVVATFEYVDTTGSTIRTAPTQFTIGTELELDTVDAGGATVPWRFAATDITRYMPNRNTAVPWRVVGNVKGVSVKSRVIWKDQVSRRARWRIQDMDTYLTQGRLQ